MIELIKNLLYSIFTALANLINSIIDFFDFDPIPDLIAQVDLSNSAVARAFGWINEFFPVTFFASSLVAFLAITVSAWIALTVWKWFKAGGM